MRTTRRGPHDCTAGTPEGSPCAATTCRNMLIPNNMLQLCWAQRVGKQSTLTITALKHLDEPDVATPKML